MNCRKKFGLVIYWQRSQPKYSTYYPTINVHMIQAKDIFIKIGKTPKFLNTATIFCKEISIY